MFNYQAYKIIKARLQGVASGFWYLGQYLKGKDNTSYIVPAIYIEMPPASALKYYGKKILAAPGTIKIHYISHAPFKNHTNDVQDSQLAAHVTAVNAINDLLEKWHIEKDGKLLSQQLLPVGLAEMKYLSPGHVITTLSYSTELYK